jgi:hypothetical protein
MFCVRILHCFNNNFNYVPNKFRSYDKEPLILFFNGYRKVKNPDLGFEEKYPGIFIGNQKERDKTKPDY